MGVNTDADSPQEPNHPARPDRSHHKMERSKILGMTERPVKGCAVLKRNETTAKSDNDG
jgi:hypothetical protein